MQQSLYGLFVNTVKSVLGSPTNSPTFLNDLVIGQELEPEEAFDSQDVPFQPKGTQMVEPAVAVGEEDLEEEGLGDFEGEEEEEGEEQDKLFSLKIIRGLHSHLPIMLQQAASMKLLYSIEKHGISMNTLYRSTKDCGPCIVILQDDTAKVFGGFASESLHIHQGFYGNGNCFLFTVASNKVQVYPATGKNDYLILSESNFIAFGGGEGRFGLWIDEQLYNGHSETCQTFGNPSLSGTVDFTIEKLEIWGFVM